VAAAQSTTDAILKRYSSSGSAALAYVLNGRIALERGRSPAEVETALASFGRVAGLFPGSEIIPQAIFYSGEALRLARRHDEALQQYRDLAMKYPTSIWTARGLLRGALSLVQAGQTASAMEGLQRVRRQFPGSVEAAAALNLNTILYRLYVRPPSPPYAFSGRAVGSQADRLRDVAGVAIDPRDRVLVAHGDAVTVFDGTGAAVATIRADNPSAVAFAPQLGPVVVRRDTLMAEDGRIIASLGIPQPDGRLKPVEEIPAAVMTSRGDWLVSDRNNKSVALFSQAGKYVKPFSAGAADRLALNATDDVAVLDRDGKQVAIFDREGRPLGRIPARGTGYELENPVDVTFDALGHLYVLDRNRAAVCVFSPQWKLVATFAPAERTPGAFPRAVAFGLDSAARLFIFDDRSQRLQVYQ
jgi:hypothetical protein